MNNSASNVGGSPLVEHLRELRDRLGVAVIVMLVGFALCYSVKEQLFDLLMQPLATAQSPGNPQMIFTAVGELFFTYLKLSFWGGFFLAFPVLLWEIWRFVAPGLYEKEQRMVFPFVIATPLLFFMGGAFTYFLVMPLVIEFFFTFETATITALPSVKEYLSFFLKMIFAFGIAFELPVLLILLALAGITDAKKLANFRRYAVVCVFVAAAILTPPDPASQLLLALPLFFLYELSIIGIKVLKR